MFTRGAIQFSSKFAVLAKRVSQFLTSGDHVAAGLQTAYKLVSHLGKVGGRGVYHNVSAGTQNIAGFASNDQSQIAFRPYDAPQVLTDLLRIEVNGANDLDFRLLQHQSHNAGANRSHTVLNNANFMSRQKASSPRPDGPAKRQYYMMAEGGSVTERGFNASSLYGKTGTLTD
jgi:hypothetical protein